LTKLADLILIPVMHLISGTTKESPQKTHYWNNRSLSPREMDAINPIDALYFPGVPSRFHSQRNPLFHIPILGGWREYVVLEPTNHSGSWHVGWKSFRSGGISRIPLLGPVRTLLGPRDVYFFGINEEGEQIPLRLLGKGTIGKSGPFAKIPLL